MKRWREKTKTILLCTSLGICSVLLGIIFSGNAYAISPDKCVKYEGAIIPAIWDGNNEKAQCKNEGYCVRNGGIAVTMTCENAYVQWGNSLSATECAKLNKADIGIGGGATDSEEKDRNFKKAKACSKGSSHWCTINDAENAVDCTKAINEMSRAEHNVTSNPYISRICSGMSDSAIAGDNGETELDLCAKDVTSGYDTCSKDADPANCMFEKFKGKYALQGKSDDDAKKLIAEAQAEASGNLDAINACKQDASKCEDESTCETYAGGVWDESKDPKCQKPASGDAAASDTSVKNTCEVEGIGWLLCPISFFLGGMADAMYGLIDDFLQIDSAQVFGDGVGLSAYRNFLPLANIILAILFVLIIYSEATGNGFGALSNYSVKKLLPRLVIFAILVNVSWYLCAAAVDISNILGANMKGFFENIAGTFADQNKNGSGNGWGDIIKAAAVGTAVGGTALVAATVATSGSAAVTALTIAGIGALATLAILIIIWLILIIRQAGVIILSIISPLAIAMGMLPNTKKLFGKWLSAFMALLITWPAVAVIFGGSGIASTILDQSSPDGWANFGMKIAAMAVKVIPLIGTPFVILSCLKAFGKAGEFISNGAMSGMRGVTGKYKKYAGQKAGTEYDRWRAHSLNNSRSFKDIGNAQGAGGKLKAIGAAFWSLPGRLSNGLTQSSYNRQQANAESKKALENILSANHEKRAATEGTQQYRDRRALNESEQSLNTSKAKTEAIKQADIANDDHLIDLNNRRLAAETGADEWKHQQNVNFANAVKTDDELAGIAGNGNVGLGKGLGQLSLEKEDTEKAKGYSLYYKQYDLDKYDENGKLKEGLESMLHKSTTENTSEASGMLTAALDKAALDNDLKAKILIAALTSSSKAIQKAAADTINSNKENKELRQLHPELVTGSNMVARDGGASLRGLSDNAIGADGRPQSNGQYLMNTPETRERIMQRTSDSSLDKISISARRMMDDTLNREVASRITSNSKVSADSTPENRNYNRTVLGQ